MRVFQEYGQKPAVVGFSVKPALAYSARTVYAGAGPNPKPLNGEASLKPILFIGDTLENIRAFPQTARRKAGQQLQQVQEGRQPDHFKPMPTVGRGVEEVRIRDKTGAFRVIYLARLENAVYVLHAFQKKTQETPQHDIDLAKSRYKSIIGSLNDGRD